MAELASTDGIPVRSALAVAVSMAVSGHAEEAKAQEDGASSSGGIEEITVTARKREESLQDVAGSIQALTGADLKRQGLLNLEDTIRMLPSVNHVGAIAGANKIIFRGVSDNPGAFIADTSAALYLDEQPLTQFTINPEPRMIDIERVEALAGPQGTLYGDASQSGTMRIITNKPDPTAFAAGADFMVRKGEDSDFSHEVSGWVNLPLVEDKFAIRLVGYNATDGGFVDNVLGVSPMMGTKDNSDVVKDRFNDVDFVGGRIAAKWFVNDEWSVTASAISQSLEAGGYNSYDPSVGDLQTVLFFDEVREDDWSQGALTIEGSFGDIDVVSVTSYFDREIDYLLDRTTYSGYFNYNFCPASPGYCWSGIAEDDQDTVGFNTQPQENDRFTQEIRLSQTADNYRWVFGVFYEEKSEYWEYRAATPEFVDTLAYAYWTSLYEPTGVDPSWWLSVDDTEWDQWAVFGNFSYNFTDNMSVEVGARYFDQESDRTYYVDKPFIVAGAFPDVTSPQGGNSDWVPKVTFEYAIDDDKMIYALYSEGFRTGGGNRNRTPYTFFPASYDPDLLKNTEIGAKTLWVDGRLQINATAYLGRWNNYQIEAVDPSFRPCETGEDPIVDLCDQPFQVMVANVGDAEQRGLELSIRAVPNDTLDLGFNLGYVNAETTESFVVTDLENPVPKGTQLPNVPEWKISTYLQATWPVLQSESIYVRAQYTWQDESKNQLEEIEYGGPFTYPDTPTVIHPSYGILDLRTGLASDAWSLEAFISNVFDERAVLYEDVFNHNLFFGSRIVTTNRPRELGVRFSYTWQ